MSTTLAGVFGGPLENLAKLIASTEAFQDWTDSDNYAEALARVHFNADLVGNWVRPACLIFWDDGAQWISSSMDGSGVQFPPRVMGNLVMRFEGLPSGSAIEEASKAFMDKVYDVIEDMGVLSGSNGQLIARGFVQRTGTPELASHESGNTAQYFVWDWGVIL